MSTRFDWEHPIAAIALRIRQSLDLPTILQTTADEVHQLLGCDRALLYRFAPDWSGQVVVESVSEPRWSLLERVVRDTCFETCWLERYHEGKHAAITDVATATLNSCYADFLNNFEIKANLVVPLLCESQLWGLLIAHNCTTPRQWQPEEINGLQQIAVHVGIALHQAALLEQLQASKVSLEAQVESRTFDLAQLAAIVEHSQDAIISKTPNGIITSWNQAAENLLGYSAQDVIGQHVSMLIPLERQAEEFQILQAIHQGEKVETYETQRIHQNGSLVDVDLTVSPIRDKHGNVIGASKILRDIRDRKQSELALKQSEATNRALIQAIPDFLVRMRCDGMQTEVLNHGVIHCLYPENGINGNYVADIMPIEIAQERIRLAEIAIATGQVQKQEYEFIDQGKTYYEKARIAPLWNDEVLVVVGDITDRKLAEETLRQSEARFQHLIANVPSMIYTIVYPQNAPTQGNRIKKVKG